MAVKRCNESEARHAETRQSVDAFLPVDLMRSFDRLDARANAYRLEAGLKFKNAASCSTSISGLRSPPSRRLD